MLEVTCNCKSEVRLVVFLRWTTNQIVIISHSEVYLIMVNYQL